MKPRLQRNPKAVWRAIKAFGTQALMAQELDVDQATVSEWARGDRPVPWPACVRIEIATRHISQQRGDESLVVTCDELQPGMDWSALLKLAAMRQQQEVRLK